MNLNDKYKTILEWATAYRKMGWNVIPLFHYSKIPAKVEVWNEDFGWMPTWKELQSRMATDKEFNHWFKEQKPTGLGVITGKNSKIFVVDEDSYKGDGMTFEFVSPMTTTTARGGTHHFFKYIDGIKTSGWRKGVNIEIKSDGGFVILPPTQVWIDEQKKTKGKYLWKTVCSLNSLPTLTEEKLKRYRLGDQWVPVDVKDLLNIGHGSRHNALRTLALKLFSKFRRDDWGVWEDFIRNSAEKYTPPMYPNEVERIISDSQKFIEMHPREVVVQAINVYGRKPKSIKEVAKARQAEKLLEKDAPKTGYPELDRLLIGFIPGHVYTMTGNTNVGKTALSVNFAERIRKQGKKVLYFALEPENTVVDYLASVRTGKMFSELTNEDLEFDDGNIQVYGKQEIPNLQSLVDAIRNSHMRFDVIFIDHIGYFIREKENFIQEQSNAIKTLAGLAKEQKIAIILIAHLRKKVAGQRKDFIPTADDIAGSGSFKQDSTEVMIVVRPPLIDDDENSQLSNHGTLSVVKTKIGPNGSVALLFSERRALIVSPGEVQTNNVKGEHLALGDQLTAMGFPDVLPEEKSS